MAAMPPQRKRTLDALDHHEPDRVPTGLWGTLQGYENLRRGLGLEVRDAYPTGSTTWTTDVVFEVDVAEKLDLDFVRLNLGPPGGSPGFRPIEFADVPFEMDRPEPGVDINTDEWGVIRKWVAHERGGYYEMIGYPLFHATSAPLEQGLEEIEAYPWPDPWDEGGFAESPIPGMTLRNYAKFIKTETPYALLGQGGRGGIFEQAKYMVGYAKIFSDFIESPEFLDALMAKLTDLEIAFNKCLIDQCGEYLDWIRISPEDLASESAAFLSPKMFKDQLLHHYHRACIEIKDYFHAKNPDGKLQFHSCGAVPEYMMSGLIAGRTASGSPTVDVYDSLPPKVRDDANPAAQKRRFGDRLSFLGGIDVQEVLPWGSPEEVRAEVRARIWEMGRGGGYLLSSSHRLEHDVPVENTIAMFEEARRFGVYPLSDEPPPGADTGAAEAD